MPTYEYLCKTCSHRFEKWQKMTDEPLTICPECGSTIRRVFYPAGIVFKGSGFYKTDHSASLAAESNGHTPKSEKDSAPTSTGEAGTAGESKPASTEAKSNTSSTSTSTGENKAAAAATK